MTCAKSAKSLFIYFPKVSKMIYSELESDFSFAINPASDFDSTSESGSQPDSESDFMNLGVCIFFTLYLHYSK